MKKTLCVFGLIVLVCGTCFAQSDIKVKLLGRWGDQNQGFDYYSDYRFDFALENMGEPGSDCMYVEVSDTLLAYRCIGEWMTTTYRWGMSMSPDGLFLTLVLRDSDSSHLKKGTKIQLKKLLREWKGQYVKIGNPTRSCGEKHINTLAGGANIHIRMDSKSDIIRVTKMGECLEVHEKNGDWIKTKIEGKIGFLNGAIIAKNTPPYGVYEKANWQTVLWESKPDDCYQLLEAGSYDFEVRRADGREGFLQRTAGEVVDKCP